MTMAYVYSRFGGELEMAQKRSGDSSFTSFLKESESPKKGKVSSSCGPTDNFQSSVVELKEQSKVEGLYILLMDLLALGILHLPLFWWLILWTRMELVFVATLYENLVRSVPEVLHLNDIVFVRGGLVEWVYFEKTSICLTPNKTCVAHTIGIGLSINNVLVKLEGDEVIDLMAYVYCESVRDGKETIMGLVDIGQNHVRIECHLMAFKEFPFEEICSAICIVLDAPADDGKVQDLLDWINYVPAVGASSSEVDA
ncbi:hypothetical protein OUZ56_012231 [Daphnia magna]|uniref:Uncharacterized protein n=1 Tax=Daphnia magna TaxID=35525 RepID=A0ABQ9Z3R1_9CRUS|nr:hypothetical protein OUZ56_012231 [Daphnia magna]